MNHKCIERILQNTEILMIETEKERDEKLSSCASDAAEAEAANYKKFLTSIYRMRNNAAALLLRSNCGCKEEYDQLILHGEEHDYSLNKKAMKNVLQKEYEEIIVKNREKMEKRFEEKVLSTPDTEATEKTEAESAMESASAVVANHPNKGPLTRIKLNYKPEDSVNKQESTDVVDTSVSASAKKQINSETLTRIHLTEMKSSAAKTDDEVKIKEIPPKNSGFFLNKTKEGKEEKEIQKKEEAVAEEKTAAKAEPVVTSGFFLNPKEESDAKKTMEAEEIKKETFSKEKEGKKILGSTSFFKPKKDDLTEAKEPEPDLALKTEGPKEVKDLEETMQFKISATDKVKEKERTFEEAADTKKISPALFRADLLKSKAVEENEKADLKESHHEGMEKVEVTETFYDLHEEEPVKKEEKRSFWFSKKKEKKQAATDYDLGVVTHEDTKPKQKVFKLSSFEPKTEKLVQESVEEKKETAFSSAAVDAEELLQRLKIKREEYDQKVIAKKIEEANKNAPSSGIVFNLATGSVKEGTVAAKETDKIEKIAKKTIQTEIRDRILEEKTIQSSRKVYTYEIQKETDRNRKKEHMVQDQYHMKVHLKDEEGTLLKTEEADFIVAPMSIPKGGFSLVSDICVYFANQYESHGVVVQPGGKTTLLIKCDEYAIFIRGSWDQGNFITAVSVTGIGCQADAEFEKTSVVPASMEGVGIGHNILYLDHATTVHIIPLSFSNNQYDRASFMAIVEKDYGIDKDMFCVLQESEAADIMVKGERYRFSISGAWEEEVLNMNVTIAH